jgi:hypothetical protein
MIFHAFQREDDDSVFTIVRNISGATQAVGNAVAIATTSADGVRVSQPVAAQLDLFRGIVAESILDSAYGKAQVHGYCSYAKVLVVNASVIVTAGYALVPQAAGVGLILATNYVSNAGYGFATALADVATGSTTVAVANSKVFLRAL